GRDVAPGALQQKHVGSESLGEPGAAWGHGGKDELGLFIELDCDPFWRLVPAARLTQFEREAFAVSSNGCHRTRATTGSPRSFPPGKWGGGSRGRSVVFQPRDGEVSFGRLGAVGSDAIVGYVGLVTDLDIKLFRLFTASA